MRLHGYCTKCHRIRRVTVRGPATNGGLLTGLCDQCDTQPPDPIGPAGPHDATATVRRS